MESPVDPATSSRWPPLKVNARMLIHCVLFESRSKALPARRRQAATMQARPTAAAVLNRSSSAPALRPSSPSPGSLPYHTTLPVPPLCGVRKEGVLSVCRC
ncbi:unnamed protein product, partial [Clonostachys byssicola]